MMKYALASVTIFLMSAAGTSAWAQDHTVPPAVQGPRVHDGETARSASAPGPVAHPPSRYARVHYHAVAHHRHHVAHASHVTPASDSTTEQLNRDELTKLQGGAPAVMSPMPDTQMQALEGPKASGGARR